MASLSPIEMIQRNAELVIESTHQQFGVSLAFDQDSVDWLDEHIEYVRKQNYAPEDVAILTNVLGSFYGECIRRLFAGEWTEYKGAYMVRLENGQLVSPFSKVMKQFESGTKSGESVAGYLATIPRMLKQFPNQKDPS